MTKQTNYSLSNKHIIIGISGSIAAYKILKLISDLRKKNAIVRIIMTDEAKKFITPLTLQTLSGNDILNTYTNTSTISKVEHINIAKWADIIILAPATANLIAKLTVGIADDLLTTTCLASTSPIAIVPAMNHQMYKSKITQINLKKLKKRKYIIWGPINGRQACNDIGIGRMIEPLKILDLLINFFSIKKDFKNIKIMITAGPTRENIDPVRFISNHSSGYMGFAIAKSAVQRGAKVTLISGPVNIKTPLGVNRINVTTCLDMYKNVHEKIYNQNIFIGCAAVSDYRAKILYKQKIKKNKNEIKIFLTKNPDIITTVANLKNNRPFVVGFAAESENIKINANKKLQEKKLDLICANNISLLNNGFNSKYNKLYLFDNNGYIQLPYCNKNKLSEYLLNEIIKRYEKN